MERKKLNVDEIIYDLKLFSNLEIEEAKKQGAEKAVLLATLTLELIQHLQAEKEELKNEYVKLDLECQKLKTENAELKSNKFCNWKIKFFKAQEEIERLTEDNELKRAQVGLLTEQVKYCKMCADNFLADYQKAQKQVDELKKYKEFIDACKLGGDIEIVMNKVKPYVILREKAYKQAVKDTAKEIYRELIEMEENPCNSREEIYQAVFGKRGVEVE